MVLLFAPAMILQFQSTQPEWAATAVASAGLPGIINISIHAARVGCDITFSRVFARDSDFNPRSPSGLRLRVLEALYRDAKEISIHAARVGCDGRLFPIKDFIINFNPRSPSGLRRERFGYNPRNLLISIHAARVGCDAMIFCTAITV